MEWIKLRSLRSTTWVLAAGVVATIALGAVADSASWPPTPPYYSGQAAGRWSTATPYTAVDLRYGNLGQAPAMRATGAIAARALG
jgi:hypothetical protein